QAGAYFGISVSNAGDVNGDGYGDVIVGARTFSNGQSGEGRAFVYHGSGTGLPATANWTCESDQANAQLGYSVSTAGDVNGDGYSDVVVGAPRFANGQSDEGRVYVYHGSGTGLSATANWTVESDQIGAELGRSVSEAGDVNGDGYGDIIAGAYRFDNSESNEGRAFVYSGSASGLANTSAWSADPADQLTTQFGRSLSIAGDVNGDGYLDVIVGARLWDGEAADEGRAYVYHGSATGLSPAASPDWIVDPTNQAGAHFGQCVSTAGDVNGDGYSDVIVGADGWDGEVADEGRAYLYYGSATGLSSSAGPNWTADPTDQAGAFFGTSVSTAGDVNGDGTSDVIVGADGWDGEAADEGRAYLYYGSATGLSSSAGPNWTADPADQAGASFGVSVSTAGDVNGDGTSDVIVGADGWDGEAADEGRAYVYHGGATGLSPGGSPDWTADPTDQAGASFGVSVSTAGDVNGDGASDVIVGAPLRDGAAADEGRAYVYHGGATGLSPAEVRTGRPTRRTRRTPPSAFPSRVREM
ncbi:MAG: FG-GAP repeat protein, partial [Planctomycetes bacterium]|nr:FG-GAP repeat protein [Planctomycetota bacterium]